MTTDPMSVMLQTESRMNHARDELARATTAYYAACDEFVRVDIFKRLVHAPTAYSPVPDDGKTNPTLATCQQEPGDVAIRGAGILQGETHET